MKHNLKISVFREPKAGGLVSCRTITVREKLISRLLGNKQKVMVLIPGNSVSTVSITDISDGGAMV